MSYALLLVNSALLLANSAGAAAPSTTTRVLSQLAQAPRPTHPSSAPAAIANPTAAAAPSALADRVRSVEPAEAELLLKAHFVVGRVVSASALEGSEKLYLCKVDAGEAGRQRQVQRQRHARLRVNQRDFLDSIRSL